MKATLPRHETDVCNMCLAANPKIRPQVFCGRLRVLLCLFSLIAVLSGSGCTAARYAKRADKETYKIINRKAADVPGMEEAFSIEKDKSWEPLEGLPVLETEDAYLGEEIGGEAGFQVLSLEHALEIAVKNSRSYQNRKESVYLQALALTLDRHRYTPIFAGALQGAIHHTPRDIQKQSSFSEVMDAAGPVIRELESISGTPGTLLRQYAAMVEEVGGILEWDKPRSEIKNERSLSGETNLGVSLLLRGGGRIAFSLSSDFLRFVTGDSRVATSSVLNATFSQPLWRGAGAKVNLERLTQSERDALYALRDFTHFRKQFVVDICSSYYGVLQNRDTVRNNWQSLENFRRSVERERAFAREGRRTQAELGRLEQALLNTENSWINALRRYKESLDQFKIQLGLSTDAPVTLDNNELDRLREEGLIHPDISAEDAVQVALAARLDYLNEQDRIEDAERKIRVAANALKPDINLFVSSRTSSRGQDNFQELDFRRTQITAGADVDLPFDRKAERNTYRATLISYERALRDFSLSEDNIKLSVRTAWRNLDQARRNHEIAQLSVELNERRVREQQLLAELGRATVLNQVDAENDLTQSRNDLTAAFIAHTLARLAFWRDMGILYIKKNGQWEEVSDAVES